MAEASSRDVIERYYKALAVGDFDTVVALHAPDLVCWMSGRSVVSGRFQGREALFDYMRHNVLGPLIVDTEDYVKSTRVVLEDGPFVVAILHGGLPNKVGGRYDQYYLQMFRMGDGVIQEIVEIFDTVMFEQAVIGHLLETARTTPASPFVIAPALTSGIGRDAMAALAERLVAAIGGGEAVEGLLAPTAELAVIGTTPHAGVAPFDAERFQAIFGRGIGWSRCVCSSGEGAVVLMRSGDDAYPQQYGLVLEAEGDRIGRISLFEDTVAAEASLYGNPLLPEPTASVKPAFDLRLAFAG